MCVKIEFSPSFALPRPLLLLARLFALQHLLQQTTPSTMKMRSNAAALAITGTVLSFAAFLFAITAVGELSKEFENYFISQL